MDSPWGTKHRRDDVEDGSFFGRGIFWVIGIIVLAVAAAIGYFYFLPHGVNVGVSFMKPDQISLGDPFTLSVSVSNYSDAVLRNAKVSLLLPDTMSFVGQQTGQRVMDQSLGDIGPGSVNKFDFNVIATANPNAVAHVQATLVYSTDASPDTQFQHPETADLSIGEPAVTLNMTAPQSIYSGQDFDLQIAYKNNTNHPFTNIHVKLDYPAIYAFKRSSVATEDIANDSWNLGNLPANSEGTITVTGNAVGQEQSFFSFNGSASAEFSGMTYPVNQQSVNLSIAQSPLSLNVALSAGSGVVHAGDPLNYSISYTNNSGVALQNVNISAKLVGEMFDFSQLRSDGSFDSITNTVSWSPANTPALANLPAGAGGSVSFQLKAKPSFPVRLLSDKNYTLKVNTEIDSPTVPPNTTADRTVSVANLENKVAGQVSLVAQAFWRDAQSGILNTGPYPMRVNQPTQFTIHWKVTATATDVANLVVSAYLQSGAKFTGKVWSNNNILPVYDPNSGLVSWNLGSVAANKGVLSAPLEAIFQIEVTPAINQINQNVPLLSTTKAQGDDLFASGQVFLTAPDLDSSLPYDTTIQGGDRTVKN